MFPAILTLPQHPSRRIRHDPMFMNCPDFVNFSFLLVATVALMTYLLIMYLVLIRVLDSAQNPQSKARTLPIHFIGVVIGPPYLVDWEMVSFQMEYFSS